MSDGLPLCFFLPGVLPSLAGLTTAITGIVAWSRPKRRGRHDRWGTCSLWADRVVFLTATILSVQRWEADASLFFLAVIGHGFALGGYGARRLRQEPLMRRVFGKQWVVAHLVGVIGPYVVLWTAFFGDNAHLIPALNQLPPLAFWGLPTVIALPGLSVSLSRFAPKPITAARAERASKGGR
jgi:hypothetical protein